jgi:hypothetical protein
VPALHQLKMTFTFTLLLLQIHHGAWSFSTALFSRRLLSSNDHRKTTCLVIEATVSKDKVDGGAVEQK